MRRAAPRVTRQPAPATHAASARVLPGHARPASTLDAVIHERMRLAIATLLAVNGSLTFTQLKRTLGMTDGNLSVHTRRLEEVGYVACEKTHEGRTSRTDYKLTPAGRRALDRYFDQMEAIIRATRQR